MQIEEKYRKDNAAAFEKIKTVRAEFLQDLNSIPYLRVIPSQANFVTAQVLAPHSSKEVTIACLENDLIIKDLSEKEGFDGKQYIRLAVRSTQDNARLLEVLRAIQDANR